MCVAGVLTKSIGNRIHEVLGCFDCSAEHPTCSGVQGCQTAFRSTSVCSAKRSYSGCSIERNEAHWRTSVLLSNTIKGDVVEHSKGQLNAHAARWNWKGECTESIVPILNFLHDQELVRKFLIPVRGIDLRMNPTILCFPTILVMVFENFFKQCH